MGSRCVSWCLLGAALASTRAAVAEDIGREPLAPVQRNELSTRPLQDTANGSTPSVAGSGEVVSARGSAFSAGQPASMDTVTERADTPKRHWYGWQTLVVDAIPALGLTVLAAQQHNGDSDQFVIAFSAGYFIGGPIVHMAHGQFGKAVLSLGIRSAGPLLIVGADQSGLNHGGENTGAIGLIILGVLAIPAAIAIDAAAIAREDVPRDAAVSTVQRLGFAPWFDPKRGAAGLAVDLSL